MSTSTYVVRRCLSLLPKLGLASIIIFGVIHLIPGDPVTTLAPPRATPEQLQQLRIKWGLNEPIYVQYWNWISNFVQGDWGRSVQTGRPVFNMIAERLPITLRFTLLATIISYVVAIPLGVLAAVKRRTVYDYLSMGFVLLAVSFPSFWFAILLILVFSIQLQWVAATGYGTLGLLILPALALGLRGSAVETRVMRSSMIESLNEDYITAARANGLSKLSIIKHAVRNALIPIITLFGLRIGWIIAAGLIVEVVFLRPGIGALLIESINTRDYQVIQAILLLLTTMIMLGNLLADLLYSVVDPRIKLDGGNNV
jgi:peptide/nickel transport system permease protein